MCHDSWLYRAVATLFPGFSPTRPTDRRARERERPWLELVTYLQNKRGPLSYNVLSGLLSTFTQWSQEEDRFANPTSSYYNYNWN